MIYVDTSVLVSLFCPDANTVAAASLVSRARDEMVMTSLGEVETVNALGLRVFRKEITKRQAASSLGLFEADVRTGVFGFREMPQGAYLRARDLSLRTTPQLGTRTADLLHVAAALELGAARFFSFDRNQRKAAEAAGLKVNAMP